MQLEDNKPVPFEKFITNTNGTKIDPATASGGFNRPSIRNTLEERGRTHGDYSNHAQVTQDIKRAIHFGRVRAAVEQGGNGVTVEELPPWMQETIDMIAHKLGRIAAGDPDFKDHWHDMAGYATLTADRCSK